MKLPPRTTPLLAHGGEYIDRQPVSEIKVRIRVDATELDSALKKLRVIQGRRQTPSRVRAFCRYLRDAGRWLNYGWGPAYPLTQEPEPASGLAIGVLAFVVVCGLAWSLVVIFAL